MSTEKISFEEFGSLTKHEVDAMLPPVMALAITSTPREYFTMSIDELKAVGRFSIVDYQLRDSFNREFIRASKLGSNMKVANIFKGICNQQYFYDKVIINPHKVALMLSPVVNYERKLSAMLDTIVDRYNQLLNMKITKTTVGSRIVNGKKIMYEEEIVDEKRAMLLLTTIKAIEERAMGAIINKSVNINATERIPDDGKLEAIDMKALNERIYELENKLDPYKQDSEVIDVTPIERSDPL